MVSKKIKDCETIFYSRSEKIAFDKSQVYINSNPFPSDELKGSTTKDFAYAKMRSIYNQILSRQYENLVVLSGSGTSVGIGSGKQKGKTMKGLWLAVRDKITYKALEEFAESIKFEELHEDHTDLEAMLSKATLSQRFLQDANIQATINNIKEIIRKECTLKLPANAPHQIFLSKLTGRKLKYSRPKIFTLNYDLLFEQAASTGGYVVIDGFSFSYPRQFNGINFDFDIVSRKENRALSEENFVPKVFQLYKPHGSLDWEKIIDGKTEKFIKNASTKNPLMIYPSNAKYEVSYEQPYFEMLSRFQQEMRAQNTILISIGFSFYDKHIKAMVDEALNVNPSITLIIVSPDVKQESTFLDYKSRSERMGNVILINETFSDFSLYYPESDIYSYQDEAETNESI
ncbi:SIR2 family protein [Sporolactobacillus sp. CPB3-1]|uniref:SIR2 family protein n=1 Tax=Sporolactobacillus mangiferae TaxID=2940498 RepID=A0ABT0MDG2_9BACL|nr:SIR2 family protein [Sporolactobacillus mangiferae]MCL1632916.1 SIR2 family protein [Sporolactobacillus mangiferae]